MTIDKETFIALYAKLEAIMPEDGVIDDTCSLINEIIQVLENYLKAGEKDLIKPKD